MTPEVVASRDERLAARITRSTPLQYVGGANAMLGRPPHVRAASSLVRFAEYLAVIQDDANFLALVDADRKVYSVPLPASAGGERVFDSRHGNRRHKLDLEACTVVPDSGGDRLIAFGSGSSSVREWVLSVRHRGAGEPEVALQEAHALYAHLREYPQLAGSGLNIEGAVFVGDDVLRLFQRGNSPATADAGPVDATADIHWPDLDAHLRDPDSVAPPAVGNIVQYQLGELDGIRLTFSDAELRPDGSILFSASAEAADGSGDIAGSVLGVIDRDGARWSRLEDEQGRVFRGKIEGLALEAGDPRRVYFVVDDDDAEQPSDLFEAQLDGPW